MKYGLIGHPIGHSFSPALFKAGYDGKYPYELIEAEDFEEAYGSFLEGYDGINVTAPFKELAFRRADILTEECRRIGATNLLVKTPEGVKAYNSDYLGVRLWLSEVAEGMKRTPFFPSGYLPPAARGVARFSSPLPPLKALEHDRQKEDERCPKGCLTVLIAGIGGAGKAAAIAAASLGMKCILMNRDISKAEAMAVTINGMQTDADVRPLEEFCSAFREADIIIYNIPRAIPQLLELSDEDFKGGKVARSKIILEANYKDPSFGKELTDRMKEANPLAGYTGGRTWLLYQAVTGYEIFTGEKPDLERMYAVL